MILFSSPSKYVGESLTALLGLQTSQLGNWSLPSWKGHGPEDAVLWPAQISHQESVFYFRGFLCGSSVQCINISITTETPWVSCNKRPFLTTLLLKPKPRSRHKTQKPWPSCFVALKQAIHFTGLCKDPILVPSRALVKAAEVGWHGGEWQCLSRAARVGGKPHTQTFPACCTATTNRNIFAVFPNRFSCSIKLYRSSVGWSVLRAGGLTEFTAAVATWPARLAACSAFSHFAGFQFTLQT